MMGDIYIYIYIYCIIQYLLVDGRIAPGIQPGPLESRLLQLGGVQAIVVGNYNEGSSALHELVSDLATQYAERAAHGATPSDHLLSVRL